MSKKFSTLMASLLLASAFSANAAEKTWVKVSQDQFVSGATYKILLQGKDSILYDGLAGANGGFWNAARPAFQAREGEDLKADTLWTVTMGDNGFQLQNKTLSGATLLGVWSTDGNMYSNGQPVANFTLGADGVLKIGSNQVWNWGSDAGGASYGLSTKANPQATKFDFYVLDNSDVTPAEGSEALAEIPAETVIYVVGPDGKYIGAPAGSDLRAAAIQSTNQLPADARLYAWVRKGDALKSAYTLTPYYLTITDGALALSETTVNLTYATNEAGISTLSTGDATVIATAYTGLTPLAYQGVEGIGGAFGDLTIGDAFVLMSNGKIWKGNANGTATEVDEYKSADPSMLWTLVYDKKSEGNYVVKFKNVATSKLLEVDGNYVTLGVEEKEGNKVNIPTSFALNAGDKYVSSTSETTELIASSVAFGLGYRQSHSLSVAALNYFEADGFSVSIKGWNPKTEDYDIDLKNNYFSGHLTPMSYNTTDKKFEALAEDSDESIFYLKNENGKYIAATATLAAGYDYAYKFVEVDASTLIRDIAKANSEHAYNGMFSFGTNDAVSSTTKVENISWIGVYDYNKSIKGTVGRLNFEDVAYLAVQPVTIYDNAPSIRLEGVKITLGDGQEANWKKVLSANFFTVKEVKADGTYVGYLTATGAYENAISKTARNILEKQWALTYQDGAYVFADRENPENTFTLNGNGQKLYTTSKENTYRTVGKYYVIEPVEVAPSDGYKRLGDVKNQKFNIGYWSTAFGANAWLNEKHSGNDAHVLGMSIDKDQALTWTATAHNKKAYQDEDASYNDYHYATDSIYVISTLG